MEACEVCGFEWEAITAAEVPLRLRSAARGYVEALGTDGLDLHRRSEPDVWSVIEYTAHARDVLFNLRDRIVVGLVEDNPTPKPTYVDIRIESGMYAADTPERQAVEIDVAADLLARTIEALTPEQLVRPIFYPWPRPATRNLLWVAAQALHEAEHHLSDVQTLVTR
jgi:hypothetical protein